jgi:hypothetical protein
MGLLAFRLGGQRLYKAFYTEITSFSKSFSKQFHKIANICRTNSHLFQFPTFHMKNNTILIHAI